MNDARRELQAKINVTTGNLPQIRAAEIALPKELGGGKVFIRRDENGTTIMYFDAMGKDLIEA